MKISIITIAKNTASTIHACLNSVHQQTYGDIEHVLIDGGSADATFALMKAFPKQKKCILRSEPDMGIYDALNKAMALCSGDIIGLLHADDFFKNEGVVASIATHFEGSDSDILHANVAYVDRKSGTQVKRLYNSRFFRPWMFRFGFSPAHPTFYIKRQLLQEFGNYKTHLPIGGDFEWMLRYLYVHKIKATYINEVWVMMRLGGASTSGLQSIWNNNRQILAACRENGVYTDYLLLYSKYFFKCWGLVFKKL